MPTLMPVDQPEFLTAVHYLAARIRESGWQPDFVIGVGRGGLIPAVFLSHATGVPMLSVDHSSHLPDFAAELLVKLAGMSQDNRLLFVDDINDTGSTITHIKKALHEAGGNIDNVRFATLIDNVVSAETVDYRFRMIDRTVNKDWFVFPWEQVSPVDKVIEDSGVVPARTA
ncbi:MULTISPECIES: phosphoribosyltransferase [unclassified Sphingomonas]|uniref:phosphoribosyltransferase n=1 Tax=unclassified Sphingomonas TaxID=196159 RepID=UPI0006FA3A08|nr:MULTISPECIES: phosphoribosyltransferase domain-containing protein [unclassified Sphingomonas]KQX20900.1 phosphoribosyltransferase [Sphingomonas sp. Root1294]KQY68746.1 phosphoribosyltransferase [Sphingomonas sp. Root50]KRB88152.1 phosphoribosyltransferase [Sphingomonas sp. Root720]